MPADEKVIRKALDDFQDKKYSDAKEKIKGEYQKAKKNAIKKKIGIEDENGDDIKFRGRKPNAQKQAEINLQKAQDELAKIKKDRIEKLKANNPDDDPNDDKNKPDDNPDDNPNDNPDDNNPDDDKTGDDE